MDWTSAAAIESSPPVCRRAGRHDWPAARNRELHERQICRPRRPATFSSEPGTHHPTDAASGSAPEDPARRDRRHRARATTSRRPARAWSTAASKRWMSGVSPCSFRNRTSAPAMSAISASKLTNARLAVGETRAPAARLPGRRADRGQQARHDAGKRVHCYFSYFGWSCTGRVLPPDTDVDHLDEHRETHREVDVALRDVLAEAVGHERHADEQQKRQRQDLDGRVRLDHALMGSAATSITSTASTTAAIMTRWSSAMPIAVMTESSENTMSSIITWPMTLANDAAGLAGPPSWPLRACRESRRSPWRAGTGRRRSGSGRGPRSTTVRAPRTAARSAAKSRKSTRAAPMRITIAAMRPTRRARFCCSFGSLADRIEMKMTLSTPRTISRNVRVTSAIRSSCMRVEVQ